MLPGGMNKVSLMLPLPEAVKPVAPPVATLRYDTLVMAAGRLSVTVAPVTVLGPLLVTTIVYVVVVPGTAVAVPSLMATPRSAVGFSVSVSVSLLFPELGSGAVPGAITLAMSLSVPVAAVAGA